MASAKACEDAVLNGSPTQLAEHWPLYMQSWSDGSDANHLLPLAWRVYP